MSFAQNFEKHTNDYMQGSSSTAESSHEKSDMKKQPSPSTPDLEADVIEFSDKKERPPRFSTLFGAAPAPAPTPAPVHIYESLPRPARRSGVYVPTPLFVLFAVILAFESIILFGYTVIGIYTLPSRLMPGSAVGYNGDPNRQPIVNVAPNFVIPQAQGPVTETITVMGNGALGDVLPTSTIRIAASLSASTGTSASTPSTSDGAAAAASNILGMLGSKPSTATTTPSSSHISATSTATVSETPTRSTVNSVLLVTVDASGSTLKPRPTVTATTVIDASQAAAASSASVAAESSIQSALAGVSAALIPKPIASSTTLQTSVLSTSSPASDPSSTVPSPTPLTSSTSAPSGTSTTSADSGFCVGGAGAVQLNCVPKV